MRTSKTLCGSRRLFQKRSLDDRPAAFERERTTWLSEDAAATSENKSLTTGDGTSDQLNSARIAQDPRVTYLTKSSMLVIHASPACRRRRIPRIDCKE